MEGRMEVTLEKIELVRDRTGVSYKEAKDALEAAEGSVVDAIIAIEETIDGTPGASVTRDVAAKKDELVEKMKDVAKKGGVSKIRVTRDGETILNIPLIAGVLGAVIAPWGVIAGVVASLGFKCKLEFVKDDGSVVDLSEKAGDVYETAKEKGAGLYSDLREIVPEGINLPENFEELKNKAQGTFNDLMDKAPGSFDELKNMAQDTFNDLKEKAPESFDEVKTRAQGTFNDIKDRAAETTDNPKFDEFKNKFDELWNKGGEVVNKAKETVAKPVRSFQEGVKGAVDDLAEDAENDIELVFGEEAPDLGDLTQGLENAVEDSGREMSQLEKDLLEMQKAAADGIKEFEDDVKH